MAVVDKIAPCKRKQVIKGNIQKWFGCEILEKLNLGNILFKNSRNRDSILIKNCIKDQNMML